MDRLRSPDVRIVYHQEWRVSNSLQIIPQAYTVFFAFVFFPVDDNLHQIVH